MIKKFAAFAGALCALFLMCVSAFAFEERPDTVSVHIKLEDIPYFTEGEAVFSVTFLKNGFRAEKAVRFSHGTLYYDIVFDGHEYDYGDRLVLRAESGAKNMVCGAQSGKTVELEAYVSTDENGASVGITDFYVTVTPEWEKTTVINVAALGTVTEYAEKDGAIFVTTNVLDMLAINYGADPSDGAFVLSSQTGGHSMRLFRDNIYAVCDGHGVNMSVAPFEENGRLFVPLYETAVHFACNYACTDTAYRREISLTQSVYSKATAAAEFVNNGKYSSRTDYLIWISKSDFKVNVYLGKKGAWRHIKAIDCAIGAPSSPTVEGTFEYYQRQSRWTYSSYYCGPIMRFHGPYAIHSTLIRYDGTPYDNRVRAKISHGCIRVRPEDIQWLVSYIPLNTRIVVTA